MSNSYQLINPHIEGDMKTKVKAKNSVEGAKMIYTLLSEHFNNNLPKFNFTIQKGSSGKGKYYSFQTKEMRNGEDIKFSIKPVSIKNEKKNYQSMMKNINHFKEDINKTGGEITKDDLDEVMDDSSDYYRKASTYVPVINHPINYFFYDPGLYKMKSLFIPTFYSYLTPFISIKMKL
tara:strand:+ start:1592 stop:2122 length:531 start_codon:yes stop_codon:yes gene_type:complete